MDDIFETMGCAFFALICLGLGLLILALSVDTIQERRAFVAITHCESQRLVARRPSFSATVVCIPDPARRDTTGVQIIRDR